MQTTATPARVLGLYDLPFWKYLNEDGEFRLQCCRECGAFRYPPGPVCHECLSPDHEWKQVSGKGEILSLIVFHKQYLPEYPAPYNVIAVRLEEGPILISNLAEDVPQQSPIGRSVRLSLARMDDGVTLPRFVLAD